MKSKPTPALKASALTLAALLVMMFTALFAVSCATAEPTPVPTKPPAAAASTPTTAAPTATAPKPPAPTATPTPKPLDKVKFRWDWAPIAYWAVTAIAQDKGWFREAGIDLQVVGESVGSLDVIKLVANKDSTFGWVSADAVVTAIQKDVPAIMIANVWRNSQSSVMFLKSKNINKPSDLEGKTVGLAPSGSADVLFPAFLKAAGVDPAKVKTASISGGARHTLVMQGTIDATAATGPSVLRYDAVGGGGVLWYADYGLTLVGHGIIANPDTVKQNPDLAKRFVATMLKAFAYVKASDANVAEAVDVMAKVYPETAKDRDYSIGYIKMINSKMYDTQRTKGCAMGVGSTDDWNDMQAILIKYTDVEKVLTPDKYFSNDYLPKTSC